MSFRKYVFQQVPQYLMVGAFIYFLNKQLLIKKEDKSLMQHVSTKALILDGSRDRIIYFLHSGYFIMII